MTTQISIEDHFDCTPKQLFDLLSDDAFDDELMKAIQMTKELKAKAEKPTGMEYKIRLTTSEPVPLIAKKFTGDHLSYVENRVWNNAKLLNTWTITPEVKGVSVEAKGTTEFVADGNGCIRRTTGSITVGIPLLGKKIEGIVLESITDTFKRNADYCRQHLKK